MAVGVESMGALPGHQGSVKYDIIVHYIFFHSTF